MIKIWFEIKRIIPLIAIISVAFILFNDVSQLMVQLYTISMTALVIILANVVRCWLFPYVHLKKIYNKVVRGDSAIAASIVFLSIILFMVAIIIVSVV